MVRKTCPLVWALGKEGVERIELNCCLFWYEIPDFLFFNSSRAFRFGFAEGKEFSLLKSLFLDLFSAQGEK